MSYRRTMMLAAIRARRYRAMHPDRKREANKKYYLANKERCIQSSDAWRKKNWSHVKIQIKCRQVGLKAPSIHELRATKC